MFILNIDARCSHFKVGCKCFEVHPDHFKNSDRNKYLLSESIYKDLLGKGWTKTRSDRGIK